MLRDASYHLFFPGGNSQGFLPGFNSFRKKSNGKAYKASTGEPSAMGRIRPTNIKRAGNKIIESYKTRLTTNFEQNKELVNTLVEVSSKKLRNLIAGHLTKEAIKAKEEQEKPI